jgi:transposase-like protein
MSDIISIKLICPHCKAENEVWGWADHMRCDSCGKMFEVREHVGSDKESVIEKIIEDVDGLWDEDKEDAKQKK